jgi:hypothetical protein
MHLTCWTLNADSLLNKRDELKARIEGSKPSIIAITEVTPKNSRYAVQEEELKIDGYECFPELSPEGRGVVIYTRKDLDAVKNESLTTTDSVWCDIKLKDNDNLLVGCIYRSPSSSSDQNDHHNDTFKKAANEKYSHILVVGDFNHPEIDWKENKCNAADTHQATKFFDCVKDTFLIQHILEPTHYRGTQQANVLDLVFTNEEGMVEDIQYEAPLGKSHHAMIAFNLMCYTNNMSRKRIVYQYDKGNYEAMRTYLDVMNWDILEELPTEECWNKIQTTLQYAQNRYVPRRQVGSLEGKKRRPLWLNDHALKKVKKKHAAWRRYMETKEGQDYTTYCQARNQAKQAVRKAVKMYEHNIASQCKKSPKNFYKYVRSKTKTKTGIGNLKHDGGVAQTDSQKAEILNDFFVSVFTKEDSNIPEFNKRDYNTILELPTITETEVKKKLAKLNPSKTPGPDQIHPRLLKEAGDSLAYPLTILFNKSIREGTVPNSWKEACITPIYKKGSKKSPGNYRPVSLTAVLCKLMESLVRDHLVSHLVNNNLLASEQHGFVSGRSCSTQLLESLEEWTTIIDDRGSVDTIYFDFQKAFDTVPHERLLKKLKDYGIQGNLLDWIRSFLSNRRQQVVVNGARSTWRPVTSGVPQGSVLGPILFVVYINDLPEMAKSQIKLFADDTKLFRRVNDAEDCEELQEDIDALEEWSRKWLLRFHPDKCKVLRLGGKNPDFNYTMTGADGQDVCLEEITDEKDLGVYIDNKLKFGKHIQQTVSKANRIVGLIRRTFTALDQQSFPLLYRSLVRPILEYGNVVWAPRFQKDITQLEGVQRRATKLVPGLQDMPYEERLQTLNLPSLVHRRKRGDMIELYKYMTGLYKVDTTWIPRAPTGCTRGHSMKLEKRYCNLDIKRHSFSQRVINSWNSLTEEIVSAPTLNCFKARLDRHWSSSRFEAQ